MRKSILLVMPLFFLIFSPHALFACSVCFGDPTSLQSKALGGAVLFLLFVIGGILAAIAFLAFVWARRAKELDAAAVSGPSYR